MFVFSLDVSAVCSECGRIVLTVWGEAGTLKWHLPSQIWKQITSERRDGSVTVSHQKGFRGENLTLANNRRKFKVASRFIKGAVCSLGGKKKIDQILTVLYETKWTNCPQRTAQFPIVLLAGPSRCCGRLSRAKQRSGDLVVYFNFFLRTPQCTFRLQYFTTMKCFINHSWTLQDIDLWTDIPIHVLYILTEFYQLFSAHTHTRHTSCLGIQGHRSEHGHATMWFIKTTHTVSSP